MLESLCVNSYKERYSYNPIKVVTFLLKIQIKYSQNFNTDIFRHKKVFNVTFEGSSTNVCLPNAMCLRAMVNSLQ
jgi:hypothetical protein